MRISKRDGLCPADHLLEQQPRDLGQQRVRENVVDVARAALDLGAARRHRVDHRVVVRQLRRDASRAMRRANLAELEPKICLRFSSRTGKYGMMTMRPRNAGLNVLSSSGLSALASPSWLRRRLRIGRQLHDRLGAGVRRQDDDRVLEIDLAALRRLPSRPCRTPGRTARARRGAPSRLRRAAPPSTGAAARLR